MTIEQQVAQLQRELAFYFGQHHGTLGHQADALACTVNDCVRVRNLCLAPVYSKFDNDADSNSLRPN